MSKKLLPLFVIFVAASAGAQTTSSGTVNGTLINKSGIAITFFSDASGLSLTGSGTSAATAAFGNISAFGTLAAGVTRPAVTSTSYTVRTPFDVQVISGGITSASYNLFASLATAAPTGISYRIDSVTLTTLAQLIQNNAAYSTSISHNLDLIVATAPPSAGGPAVGTVVSRVINVVAISN